MNLVFLFLFFFSLSVLFFVSLFPSLFPFLEDKLSDICVECGWGVGEDASVRDIHGTGRVSVSRHYNFFRDVDSAELRARVGRPQTS